MGLTHVEQCFDFDESTFETSGVLLFVTLLPSCHTMSLSNSESVKGVFFKSWKLQAIASGFVIGISKLNLEPYEYL